MSDWRGPVQVMWLSGSLSKVRPLVGIPLPLEVACWTVVRVLKGVGAEGVCRCGGSEVLLGALERREEWLVCTTARSGDCAGSGIQSHRPVLIVAGGLYYGA